MTQGEFRILAVCTGNVNRSALAESLLRTWVDWYVASDLRSHISVESAGLGAPEGEPMRHRVRAIAAELGADGGQHRARQINDRLIRDADIVLTASLHQRDAIVQRVPGALRYTFTIREAGRIAQGFDTSVDFGTVPSLRDLVQEMAANRSLADAGESSVDGDDILDPEGLDDEAFRQMARDEVPALARLAALMFGMPRPDLDAYVSAPDVRDLLRGTRT